MKVLFWGLPLLLLWLQYSFWLGEAGFRDYQRLRGEIALQQTENSDLDQRNRQLAAATLELKQGLEAIEAKARMELGLIKEGERFYYLVETP